MIFRALDHQTIHAMLEVQKPTEGFVRLNFLHAKTVELLADRHPSVLLIVELLPRPPLR